MVMVDPEWYFVMRKSQGCWRVLVNGADQTYRGSLRCLEEKAKRTNYGKSVSHTKLAVVAQRGIDAAVAGASWYPLACCGKMDCFPVACDQLVETGSGWFYDPTSNLFKREQVQPSQDHHCHVCLGRGREHPSICAFIVPNV